MNATTKLILLSVFFNYYFVKPCLSQKSIEVSFNKNIELLGMVYFLGYLGPELESSDKGFTWNGEKFSWKQQHSFGWHLYNKYKPHAANPHLLQSVKIIRKNDVFLDYLSNLFLQLDDFPNAQLKPDIGKENYLRFSKKGDHDEAQENVVILINAMNKLYTALYFDKYLRTYSKIYEHALGQVKANLPPDNFIASMEEFYGKEFDAYQLVPSLTIPSGMAFAGKHMRDARSNIFNVFGPLWFQSFENEDKLDMSFNDKKRIRELSIHEFGHSFVNPVLEAMPEALIQKTKKLYKPIKKVMTDQGYPNWKYCLNEHFVRAGEVIISRNMGYFDEAAQLEKDYVENKNFIYLPFIVTELEKYNKDRNRPYHEAVQLILEKME